MIKAKYIDLSKDLESAIKAGKWDERLPGVFRLAEEYKVDPATVSKAIKLLEKKGLVTINGRRGTFVTRHQEPKPQNKIVGVLGISPSPSLTAIKEEFKKHSYEVMAISQNDELLKSNPHFWTKLPLDGIIFMNSSLTRELISALRQSNIPFVSCNKIFDIPGISWVDFGSEDGLADLIRHLHKLGHRRIAYASIYYNKNYYTERLRKVYYDTCAELKCLDEDLFFVPESSDGIYDMMDIKNKKISAVVSPIYDVIEKIKTSAEAESLKIPEDLSLAVFKLEPEDNFYTISYFHNQERARLAAQMLLRKLRNPVCEVEQILLKSDLIPGKSTVRYKTK